MTAWLLAYAAEPNVVLGMLVVALMFVAVTVLGKRHGGSRTAGASRRLPLRPCPPATRVSAVQRELEISLSRAGPQESGSRIRRLHCGHLLENPQVVPMRPDDCREAAVDDAQRR